MLVNLITVSKLCRNIIYSTTIELNQINHPCMDDILNKIHEKYPILNDTDYTLYWCYTHDEFFKIRDYLSYITALTLMADRSIYLILNDCGDDCHEINEAFLRKLDHIDEKGDKYDVKIAKHEEESESEEEDVEEVRSGPIKDEDILRFARRRDQRVYYYTDDLKQKFKMIEDAKRGIVF